MNIPDTFSSYLERKNLSPRTKKFYFQYCNRIDAFTKESVELFLTKYSKNIVARAFLKNFKEHLEELGEDVSKIKITKPTGKKRRKIPDVITEGQLFTLEKGMRKERDKLLLLISFYAGLRADELIHISPNSFNWNTWVHQIHEVGTLKVKGKFGKDRVVPIPPFLMMRVYNYIWNLGDIPRNEPFWKLSYDRWHEIVNKASIMALGFKIKPHTLRYSCATYLYEKGMKLEDIKLLLGHESINTTLLYAQITPKNLIQKYSELKIQGNQQIDNPPEKKEVEEISPENQNTSNLDSQSSVPIEPEPHKEEGLSDTAENPT